MIFFSLYIIRQCYSGSDTIFVVIIVYNRGIERTTYKIVQSSGRYLLKTYHKIVI